MSFILNPRFLLCPMWKGSPINRDETSKVRRICILRCILHYWLLENESYWKYKYNL